MLAAAAIDIKALHKNGFSLVLEASLIAFFYFEVGVENKLYFVTRIAQE